MVGRDFYHPMLRVIGGGDSLFSAIPPQAGTQVMLPSTPPEGKPLGLTRGIWSLICVPPRHCAPSQ